MKRAMLFVVFAFMFAPILSTRSASGAEVPIRAETAMPIRAEAATVFLDVGVGRLTDCETCTIIKNDWDCEWVGYWNCWTEVDMGTECTRPGPPNEDCYTCESFYDGGGDCGDVDTFYWEGYSPLVGGWVQSWLCGSNLEYCPDDPDNSVALAALALDAADVLSLATIIEESDGKVFINHARRALQGVGCNGGISLHVPLDPEVLRSLARRIDSK